MTSDNNIMEMETSFSIPELDENVNGKQDSCTLGKIDNSNGNSSIHVPSTQSSYHSISDDGSSSDGTVLCDENDNKHECMINDDQSLNSLDDLDIDLRLLNSEAKDPTNQNDVVETNENILPSSPVITTQTANVDSYGGDITQKNSLSQEHPLQHAEKNENRKAVDIMKEKAVLDDVLNQCFSLSIHTN